MCVISFVPLCVCMCGCMQCKYVMCTCTYLHVSYVRIYVCIQINVLSHLYTTPQHSDSRISLRPIIITRLDSHVSNAFESSVLLAGCEHLRAALAYFRSSESPFWTGAVHQHYTRTFVGHSESHVSAALTWTLQAMVRTVTLASLSCRTQQVRSVWWHMRRCCRQTSHPCLRKFW